jgi:hypothetical protein
MQRDTIEFDHNTQTTDAGDKQLFVQFYMHFIKDEEASITENRPIFKDQIFTKIFPPGDRTNIIDRPFREGDQFRFPAQYARFKQNQDQRASGTPLEMWPVVSKAMAEELKFFGFQTVEQLAGASDDVCSKRMGLSELKNKATVYLQVAAGDTKPLAEMSKEMTDLKSQIEVLTRNLADAVKRIPTEKAK